MLNLTAPLTKLPFFTAHVAGNGLITIRVPPFIPSGTVVFWQVVEVTSARVAFLTSQALVVVTQ